MNQSRCTCGDANCRIYRRQRFYDTRAKQLEIELDNAYAERRKARAEWVSHLDSLKAAA